MGGTKRTNLREGVENIRVPLAPISPARPTRPNQSLDLSESLRRQMQLGGNLDLTLSVSKVACSGPHDTDAVATKSSLVLFESLLCQLCLKLLELGMLNIWLQQRETAASSACASELRCTDVIDLG